MARRSGLEEVSDMAGVQGKERTAQNEGLYRRIRFKVGMTVDTDRKGTLGMSRLIYYRMSEDKGRPDMNV